MVKVPVITLVLVIQQLKRALLMHPHASLTLIFGCGLVVLDATKAERPLNPLNDLILVLWRMTGKYDGHGNSHGHGRSNG